MTISDEWFISLMYLVFLTWLDAMIAPQSAAMTMSRLVSLVFIMWIFTVPILDKTVGLYNNFISDENIQWNPSLQHKKDSKNLNFNEWKGRNLRLPDENRVFIKHGN